MKAVWQGSKTKSTPELPQRKSEEGRIASVRDITGHKSAQEEEIAVVNFVEYIKRLFPFDRFTQCIKEGNEGVIRHVIGQVDDLDKGLRFPIDDGLNGWILKRNAPLLISDMEEGDYPRPRYYQGEGSKRGLRSFLGIPLADNSEVWGSVSLESRIENQYGEKEKEN